MDDKTHFEKVPLEELVRRGIVHPEDLPAPELRNGKPTVLVVDDERTIADTLATIISRNGYHAFPAYDGDSALKVAKSHTPDILITDIVMPGMDGIELSSQIHNSIPGCKIVLFSGQANTLSQKHFANCGAFLLLAKPMNPRDFLDVLAELTRDSAYLPRNPAETTTPPG